MRIVYANDVLETSIFLAGPTPRSTSVESWRPQAIQLLKQAGFPGTVYTPETSNNNWTHEYYNQIEWEWSALQMSTVVLFWVPRELTDMPAFTTNVEFGYLASSGKVLLGSPEGAPKMKYLQALAARHNIPIYSDLELIVTEAVTRAAHPYRSINDEQNQ